MKVAFISHFDLLNPSRWQRQQMGNLGSSLYMYKSLKNACERLEYIGPLEERHSLAAKLENLKYKICRKLSSSKTYHYWAEPSVNQNYAKQLEQKLSQSDADIIFSPQLSLLSYLDCPQPTVVWTDSTCAGIIPYYPDIFGDPVSASLKHITELDRRALQNCSLAIFSSDWAAKTAIELYQVDPHKVKVVPTGVNMDCDRTEADIKDFISRRSRKICQLLFVGVDWHRKGGDIALDVIKKLNQLNFKSELVVVGCQPISEEPLPDFVRVMGFINKSTEAGKQKLDNLFQESHFLIMPSRGDCTPASIREASSFGLPSLSTNFGGIPTLIKDEYNGKVFDLEADIQEYCNYIIKMFNNIDSYQKLAISSFNEYQTRLNWNIAARQVKELLMSCI